MKAVLFILNFRTLVRTGAMGVMPGAMGVMPPADILQGHRKVFKTRAAITSGANSTLAI